MDEYELSDYFDRCDSRDRFQRERSDEDKDDLLTEKELLALEKRDKENENETIL